MIDPMSITTGAGQIYDAGHLDATTDDVRHQNNCQIRATISYQRRTAEWLIPNLRVTPDYSVGGGCASTKPALPAGMDRPHPVLPLEAGSGGPPTTFGMLRPSNQFEKGRDGVGHHPDAVGRPNKKRYAKTVPKTLLERLGVPIPAP